MTHKNVENEITYKIPCIFWRRFINRGLLCYRCLNPRAKQAFRRSRTPGCTHMRPPCHREFSRGGLLPAASLRYFPACVRCFRGAFRACDIFPWFVCRPLYHAKCFLRNSAMNRETATEDVRPCNFVHILRPIDSFTWDRLVKPNRERGCVRSLALLHLHEDIPYLQLITPLLV